ncbi:MAG: glycoside hydrolase family 97 N-terminal domain-containing protein, partial [Mangrovibacterium sp.]|nr:glycoside hydrolase family 97 N-terminal domain-containing protein [Mangrovibacterium sp.]
MKDRLFFLIAILSVCFNANSRDIPAEVGSPDGKLTLNFSVISEGMFYSICYMEQPVVLESALGIDCNGESWTNGLVLKNQSAREQDTTWHPVYGERSEVRD